MITNKDKLKIIREELKSTRVNVCETYVIERNTYIYLLEITEATLKSRVKWAENSKKKYSEDHNYRKKLREKFKEYNKNRTQPKIKDADPYLSVEYLKMIN